MMRIETVSYEELKNHEGHKAFIGMVVDGSFVFECLDCDDKVLVEIHESREYISDKREWKEELMRDTDEDIEGGF